MCKVLRDRFNYIDLQLYLLLPNFFLVVVYICQTTTQELQMVYSAVIVMLIIHVKKETRYHDNYYFP